MKVVLATDRRGRVILGESAKKLRLPNDVRSRLDAKLKTIEGATFPENLESRLSDLDTRHKLKEIKVAGVGTQYRVACCLANLGGGEGALVVGRLFARKQLNGARKSNLCTTAKRELDEFILKET